MWQGAGPCCWFWELKKKFPTTLLLFYLITYRCTKWSIVKKNKQKKKLFQTTFNWEKSGEVFINPWAQPASANTRVPSSAASSKVNAHYPALIMISWDYLSLWYFYYFEQEERKRHLWCRFQTSPLVGEGLRLRGLLLCALFAAAQPKNTRRSPETEKNHLLPQTLNSGSFTQTLLCLELFQGSQIISTSKNFIDIIANNGRCFPAGNNGLVPLIIVIINRKSSGWKRAHAQKCSPGFGLSIFVVGDCFSLSPVFLSHLWSCSASLTFLNASMVLVAHPRFTAP